MSRKKTFNEVSVDTHFGGFGASLSVPTHGTPFSLVGKQR